MHVFKYSECNCIFTLKHESVIEYEGERRGTNESRDIIWTVHKCNAIFSLNSNIKTAQVSPSLSVHITSALWSVPHMNAQIRVYCGTCITIIMYILSSTPIKTKYLSFSIDIKMPPNFSVLFKAFFFFLFCCII